MPRTAEVEVFQFDELSPRAKERARDWYREGMNDDQWWDSIYEDAETCAAILGITIKYRTYTIAGKVERIGQEPCIWFSGFSSQGDGACFEGSYEYAKGCGRKIRKHAPPVYTDKDGTVHKSKSNARLAAIADGLVELQKRYNWRLTASVNHTGRYSHPYCTEIDVEYEAADGTNYPTVDDAKILAELLRDFMRWIYRQLQDEWNYLNSDETVDDNIRANEYEFDEDGDRWRD